MKNNNIENGLYRGLRAQVDERKGGGGRSRILGFDIPFTEC
jgi:hypothetical protein